MAFMEKLFRKDESENLEEILNNLDVEEDNTYDDATALVKPVVLSRDQDVEVVVNELKQGNFILLNIAELKKRNALKLRELVDLIRGKVGEMNGDLALVSQEKVLLTPSKIKIVKRK